MLVDEHTHQVDAHVGRLLVQLEESAVVALRQCLPYVHGMHHALILPLLLRKLLHHPQRLHFHPAEYLIQDLVCQKFLNKI